MASWEIIKDNCKDLLWTHSMHLSLWIENQRRERGKKQVGEEVENKAKGKEFSNSKTLNIRKHKTIIISSRPATRCSILITVIKDYEKWSGGVSQFLEFLSNVQSPVYYQCHIKSGVTMYAWNTGIQKVEVGRLGLYSHSLLHNNFKANLSNMRQNNGKSWEQMVGEQSLDCIVSLLLVFSSLAIEFLLALKLLCSPADLEIAILLRQLPSLNVVGDYRHMPPYPRLYSFL